MPNFAYADQFTPVLEPLPDDVTLNERVIIFNEMPWQARSDCNYQTDYYRVYDRTEQFKLFVKDPVKNKKWPHKNPENMMRAMMQEDLFFLCYFVLRNPLFNHPFAVEVCKEIQNEAGNSIELWAREHLKSSAITVCKTIQRIINNPELKICIFSANRPLAVAFLKQIRSLFETRFMKDSFPDVLYEDPSKQADKWSEGPDGGLIVRRQGIYKEPTVSAFGLSEGLPVGPHYDHIVYDDIVTQETISPGMTQVVRDNFDISLFLGTREGTYTVVGTTYRHDDALCYIKDKTDPETGEPMFKCRIKPATVDGTIKGKSVFLPEKRMKFLRASSLYKFRCQQLLDPTPIGAQKLNPEALIPISKEKLPRNLYKFLLIDAAGSKGKRVDDRKPDAWAIGVIGVEPFRDDVGYSKMFILDLVIRELDLIQALRTIVQMVERNGRIRKIGVEKVGLSTTEVHVANELRAKGKTFSIDKGNLQILRHGGEAKEFRIESNLASPLEDGKWHYVDTIAAEDIKRLRLEMEKFPYWHDDGVDMCSNIYQLIKDYKFSAYPEEEQALSAYDRIHKRENIPDTRDGYLIN